MICRQSVINTILEHAFSKINSKYENVGKYCGLWPRSNFRILQLVAGWRVWRRARSTHTDQSLYEQNLPSVLIILYIHNYYYCYFLHLPGKLYHLHLAIA